MILEKEEKIKSKEITRKWIIKIRAVMNQNEDRWTIENWTKAKVLFFNFLKIGKCLDKLTEKREKGCKLLW